MNENELAAITVDICIKIHQALGPGLLESVYEAAIAHELKKRNIPYTRQEEIIVEYDGVVLNVGFRADIIIDDLLLLELKSVEHIEKVHHKTILTYLKLTGIKLGLLINFKVDLLKEGIFRKINGRLYQ